MGSLEEIRAGYDGLRASQEAFYKDLHRHPELSHQEHRTAERVAGKLQEYGCTVQTGIGGTGVACWRASPFPTWPWPSICCPAWPGRS
jgi:metal-dependent amidase/aminoacylase/carboxypeptidase family protein